MRLVGWQFRQDAPTRTPPESPEWSAYAGQWEPWTGPPVESGDAWFRVRIPQGSWDAPALSLGDLAESYELFVEGERLLSYGSMQGEQRLVGWRPQILPLPRSALGHMLYVHARSFNPNHIGVLSDGWIGERMALPVESVIRDLARGLMGLASVTLGLAALIVFLRRREDGVFLSFALFAAASGANLFASSSFYPLIYDKPGFWLWAHLLGRALAPPLMVVFVMDCFELFRSRLPSRIIWGIAGFCVLMVAVASLSGGRIQWVALQAVNVEMLLAMGALLVVLVWGVYLRRPSARTVLAAFLLLFAATAREMMNRAPSPDASAIAWALFVLLLALSGLLLRRFTEVLEQLQGEVRSRDEFLSIASHELRNPLAVVAAGTRLLGKTVQGVRAREQVDLIERQVVHLTRMVDDLSDISRFRHGKLTLRLEPLDLVDALEQSVKDVRPMAAERKIEIHFVQPPNPTWVEGDPVRLYQVFHNLLRNAVQYTPEGGQISLTVQSERGEAAVRLQDTGAGMSPKTLSRLFHFYQRGSSGLAGRRDGMGVGLALVRRLLALHQGSITASSEGPGLGSAFEVRLPTRSAPTPQPVPSIRGVLSPAPRAKPEQPPRQVLLIDDNANLRLSLKLLLEASGFRVEEADDGRRGLAKLLEGTFDAAVVDLQMPEMDGLEVARRIRASELGLRIRLVALTGHGLPEDRQRAEAAGFDHVLVKPADPDHLARLLEGP